MSGVRRDGATLPYGNLAQIARQLRRDARASVIATGSLPPLNAALYIEDEIDAEVTRWVQSTGGGLLVLTGSAGHGKSATISVALQHAQARSVEVRHDASQADAPDESYVEGLRRFLDNWLEDPTRKYILGINLGKALDFFSDKPNIERYLAFASAMNKKFDLGLDIAPKVDGGVLILDLAARVRPTSTDTGLDLALFRRILERFDPEMPGNIVQQALEYQVQHGLGPMDPLVCNLRLLGNSAFRHNLVEAVASAIVRHDLHLTPRRMLDLISRMMMPPSVEPFLTSEGEWIEEAASLRETASFYQRCEQTLLASIFPREFDAIEVEDDLLRALRHEDPALVRTKAQDQRLFAWASDFDELKQEVPAWFLAYLGWDTSREVGGPGTRLLLQVASWNNVMEPRPARIGRVIDFLRLVQGKKESLERHRDMLQLAIRQSVTKSHYRVTDPDTVGSEIALQVHRSGTDLTLRTELGTFDVTFDLHAGSGARTFQLIVSRPPLSFPITIDWPTFDLLCDIYIGNHPGTARRSGHAIEALRRKLQPASHMGSKLVCNTPDIRGALRLARNPITQTRIDAEVQRA